LKRTIEKVIETIETNKYKNDINKTAGTFVYAKAIKEIIQNNKMVSYREYGFDYESFFNLKFQMPNQSYINQWNIGNVYKISNECIT